MWKINIPKKSTCKSTRVQISVWSCPLLWVHLNSISTLRYIPEPSVKLCLLRWKKQCKPPFLFGSIFKSQGAFQRLVRGAKSHWSFAYLWSRAVAGTANTFLQVSCFVCFLGHFHDLTSIKEKMAFCCFRFAGRFILSYKEVPLRAPVIKLCAMSGTGPFMQ